MERPTVYFGLVQCFTTLVVLSYQFPSSRVAAGNRAVNYY